MKELKLLWSYLKGYRFLSLILTLSTIGLVFFVLFTPLLLSFIIDSVINGLPVENNLIAFYSSLFGGVSNIHEKLYLGAIMIMIVTLGRIILMYYRGKLNGIISERFAEKLRNDLFQHIQHWPYHTHVNSKTGDLIQRVTSDVDTIRRFIAAQYSELVYSIATAIIATIVLFSIYTKLAWIAIISLPILVLVAYVFFMKIQVEFRKSDEAEGELSTILQENISAVRVVKAFNREVYEVEKFDKSNQSYRDITFRLIVYLAYYWGGSDLIILTQIFIVVLFGIFEAQAGHISLGDFTVFVSYETMILWPIRQIGRILSDLGKMLVSLSRLNEILDEKQEDLETGLEPDLRGSIEFKHVRFRFEDGNTDVLKDISFDVKKGQTVAIIGPTGSGKSSLVHLMMRLYEVSEGQILINGHDIKTISKHHLRKNVGIVLQEPYLFSKTILENIKIANSSASERDVMKAAQLASVHQVISEFDQGYETLVGEKGVTLSGGQKQRIAIARTIVNNSPILIFDDSLSAVDTETDANIRSGLKQLSKDVTTLIITHRVNTAMEADQILVLEDGLITQRGTHKELASQVGLYARIVAIQDALGGEKV